jgi:hypothetical protein
MADPNRALDQAVQVQNWRNYAAYYVILYIGQRDVQDINGAVCDALYAKLLAEGRVKAKPKRRQNTHALYARRLAPDGRALPCRPCSYDAARCFRTHAEDDPAIGRPIEATKLGRRAAEGATEAAQRKLPPGQSDGKTENAQHVLALDPFTLAVLKAHVEMLDRERKDLGPDYDDHGVLFCWPDGRPPHPDTIIRRFKQLAAAAGLPEIDLHADVASMKQYVQTDLKADRQVANTLAELIIGSALASTVIPDEERADQGATADGDPGEAA